jgi:hypothetical protein
MNESLLDLEYDLQNINFQFLNKTDLIKKWNSKLENEALPQDKRKSYIIKIAHHQKELDALIEKHPELLL